MKNQLRSAAADCDLIAKFPQSGEAFKRMRKSLKLVEGCCRQAAHWREDARWLSPALHMEHAHQIAREWLHRPTVQSKKLFTGLAAALRQILADLLKLETMPSGRVGSIIVPGYGNRLVNLAGHPLRMPAGLVSPAVLQ